MAIPLTRPLTYSPPKEDPEVAKLKDKLSYFGKAIKKPGGNQMIPALANATTAGVTGYYLLNGAGGGAAPSVPVIRDIASTAGANAEATSAGGLLSGMVPEMSTVAPWAGIAGGGAAAVRGLHEAGQSWNRGRGEQQTAVEQALNPVATGINAILPGGLRQKPDSPVMRAAAAANPAAWPFVAADVAGINFWSGKDPDQRARDAVRGGMRNWFQNGEDWQLRLPNGSTFDVGKDGGAMLSNADGGQRHYYDVDWKQEGVGDVVGAVDPLAAIVTGGKPGKLQADFVGYFANAATSGGDPMENVRAIYQQAGLDRDTAYTAVLKMREDGKIDDARRDAYLASVDRVFGVLPESQEEGPSESGSGGSRRRGDRRDPPPRADAPSSSQPINYVPTSSGPSYYPADPIGGIRATNEWNTSAPSPVLLNPQSRNETAEEVLLNPLKRSLRSRR